MVDPKVAEDLLVRLREINEMDLLEQHLKSNVNEFIFDGKIYRIRKPNTIEKELAHKERMKKYFEMLTDSSYLFKKDLVSIYKSKNVDLDGLDRELKGLYLSENDLLKRLDLAKQNKQDIEVLENEIYTLRKHQDDLQLHIDTLLEYCIERQLDKFLKCYFVFLVLEIKNGEVWEKLYKTYDDFLQSTDDLLQMRAAQQFGAVIFNEKL